MSNKTYIYTIAGCLATITTVSLLIAHWQEVGAFWLVARWFLALLALLALLYALYAIWHRAHMKHLTVKQKKTEIQLLAEQAASAQWIAEQKLLHEQEMESKRLQLEILKLQIQQSQIIAPATHSVYVRDAGYIALQAGRFGSGKALAGTSIEEIEQSQTREAPAQDFILSRLPENCLLVSPGIRQSTGDIVKICITEIPHLKIIGSSGFGKSCLAASLLDQVVKLNTPDIVQVALLDLEHKTSKLFENLPHVAELLVGQRRVPMVATDADEVAQHFGILKKELDRRARLPEDELEVQPVLLMYVEEMLSLQYEVDEKLLDQMLAQLTILAVRGRKYRMFLLCCAQTDYSTEELRTAQKMFRFRAAAGIDTRAALAAGFMSTELIKQNFQTGIPGSGQFVVEYPSFSDMVLAPRYDWKVQLKAQKTVVPERFTGPLTPPALPVVNASKTSSELTENKQQEQARQARAEQVKMYLSKGWGKLAIIDKVWGVKRGGSPRYTQAEIEYNAIVAEIGE